MSILTIFFSRFLPWGFHSHLLELNTSQGDPLFTLVHFCAFCLIIVVHFTCVFLSLADDTHIISPTSNVVLVFLQLQQEFLTLRLSMQLTKCVAWSSQGLDHFISLLPRFLTFDLVLDLLVVLLVSYLVVKSFFLFLWTGSTSFL